MAEWLPLEEWKAREKRLAEADPEGETYQDRVTRLARERDEMYADDLAAAGLTRERLEAGIPLTHEGFQGMDGVNTEEAYAQIARLAASCVIARRLEVERLAAEAVRAFAVYRGALMVETASGKGGQIIENADALDELWNAAEAALHNLNAELPERLRYVRTE